MHPSVGFASSSPCRGAFPNDSHPQSLPCKGRCRRRRRRGAAPGPTNILPGRRKASGGRKRPPYNVRQAGSITGYDKPPHAPAQGPMISSARRRAWWAAGVHLPPPGPGHNVGRAISPAAWGLRHGRVCGTMQASSPTNARQGAAKLCGVSPPRTGNAPLSLRLAAHPAPLAGEPSQTAVTRKASPARGGAAAGGGGVRRLALPISFRAASLLRRGR